MAARIRKFGLGLCLISLGILTACQSDPRTVEMEAAHTVTLPLTSTDTPTVDWRTVSAEAREGTTEAVNSTQTASAATYIANHPTPSATPAPFKLYEQVNGASIYLWGENLCAADRIGDTEPIFIAQSDLLYARLSPDGQLAAYLTHYIYYDEIWVMELSSGETRRLMTTEPIMQDYGLDNLQVMHLKWIPQSHTIAFNTGIGGFGGFTFTDLHTLNADTGDYQQVITATVTQQFGDLRYVADDVYPSPDGKHIALVTGKTVSLVGVDGSNWLSQIFEYDEINTHAGYLIFAKPVWTPTSDGMWIAVPPTNRETEIEVWHISISGQLSQIASIPLDVPEGYGADATVLVPLVEHAYVSPTGEYVAYAGPAQDIITISTLGGAKATIDLGNYMLLQGWIDNTHFKFSNYGGNQPSADYIGDVNGDYVAFEGEGAYFPCSE